jgi:hypothetical protein
MPKSCYSWKMSSHPFSNGCEEDHAPKSVVLLCCRCPQIFPDMDHLVQRDGRLALPQAGNGLGLRPPFGRWPLHAASRGAPD